MYFCTSKVLTCCKLLVGTEVKLGGRDGSWKRGKTIGRTFFWVAFEVRSLATRTLLGAPGIATRSGRTPLGAAKGLAANGTEMTW